MQLQYRRFDLQLAHHWTTARGLAPGGDGGIDVFGVVFAELRDKDGVMGLGEAAPSRRYHDSPELVWQFLSRVEAARLSFGDVEDSMAYVNSLSPRDFAAKGALNAALLDGAARMAGQPLCDYLGLGFTEGKHVTSFSIGIDQPEIIREKVLAAQDYPVLKLKLGSPRDRENLRTLREVAPHKPVRVDANEAWTTKEAALAQIEWLAQDGRIEFVEQAMPATTELKDWIWLSRHSPLPLMADESCHFERDIPACAEWAQAVNVKLVKTGGVSGAYRVLQTARKAGLKTMLGCMIESSLLISAGAHLAELTDYLDLDGNLLIKNDPYCGVRTAKGALSFSGATEPCGLRVRSI